MHKHLYNAVLLEPGRYECISQDGSPCTKPVTDEQGFLAELQAGSLRGTKPPPQRRVRHYQEASRQAWKRSDTQTTQDMVLAVIHHGPRTTDEVEIITGKTHQSVSAAMSTLWHKRHLVHPNGEKRSTRSGNPADVYAWGLTCEACPGGRDVTR